MTLYWFSDPQVERQLRRDLGIIRAPLELESTGGLYYMKNTISLSVAGRGDFDETIDALPTILGDQATADTEHFGEVMVVDQSGPVKRASQRVSTPHLWEGALYYLTALAVEDPDALLRYEEVLPPSRVRQGEMPSSNDGGCQCHASPSATATPLALAVLALFALGQRRRRHRP